MQRQQRWSVVHFNRRGVRLAALVGMLSLGCGFFASGVADPRAVGSRHDRWESVIPRARSTVFDVAVRTLTDSGYVLAQTNSGVSAISTADRRVKQTPRLPGDPESLATDYRIRLSLVLTPIGADSTRLSITGQYRSNNRSVDARSDDWYFVRGIGEAILERVR